MRWTLKRPTLPRMTPEMALIIKNGVGDVGKKCWSFAAMMFLITLKPGTMDLVAGHTMALSIATFIFANPIGTLIDRIPRLTAIRVAIGGQALGVAVIALTALAVQIKGDVLQCVPTELYVVFGIICFMDTIAKLAKEASSIIIGRDWTVTVCEGDRDRLAKLNVWTTRTDEVFGIIAPVAISSIRQVLNMMQTTIIGASGYFIATCIQYGLIMFVYNHVQGIRSKPKKKRGGGRMRGPQSPPPPYTATDDVVAVNGALPLTEEEKLSGRKHGGRKLVLDHDDRTDLPKGPAGVNGLPPPDYGSPKNKPRRGEEQGSPKNKPRRGEEQGSPKNKPRRGGEEPPNGPRRGEERREERRARRKENGGDDSPGQKKKEEKKKGSRKPNIFDPRELYKNFRKFFSYRIALAGLCQSMQHLSLVSFGIVTMLYLRGQGMNYIYLGVSRSMTGVIAILSSILFPRFLKRYGLIAAGLLGCLIQVGACGGALVAMYVPNYPIEATTTSDIDMDMCVGNFLPNETFPMPEFEDKFTGVDPNFYFNDEGKNKKKPRNSTERVEKLGENRTEKLMKSKDPDKNLVRMDESNVAYNKNMTKGLRPKPNGQVGSGKGEMNAKGGKGRGKGGKGGKGKPDAGDTVDTADAVDTSSPSPSAIILLCSLLIGRFGTYLSKISIHQLYQEEIPRQERGMIAGVQVTMNTFFNTIAMAVVLYASTPDNFIYLVWMSTVVEFSVMAIYGYFAFNYAKSRGGISDTDAAQPQMLEEEEEEEEAGTSLEERHRTVGSVQGQSYAISYGDEGEEKHTVMV